MLRFRRHGVSERGLARAGAVLAMALLFSTPALSQDRFDVGTFHVAPSQGSNYISVISGRVLSANAFEFGVFLDFADDPFVFEVGDNERIGGIVSEQWRASITGAWGIANRLELGFEVPVIFFQHADEIFLAPSLEAREEAGLGDIRFIPKLQLYDGLSNGDSGAQLAVSVDVYFPTGDVTNYQGEGFRVHPRLAFDYAFSRKVRFGVNAGWMARDGWSSRDLEIDDQITYALAAEIQLTDEFALIPEVEGSTGVLADDLSSAELSLEGRIGGRYAFSDVVSVVGAFGLGLMPGAGVPDYRVVAGLAYGRSPEPDTDRDGLRDSRDRCPEDPEDFDEFEDEDGCPEPDNDMDSYLDEEDGCPLEREDFDEFEDEDGCPDVDNDNDGVLDVDDDCHMAPEDIDAFQDQDGCPDIDNDMDGILDVADGCPMEPEDFDNDQDEDGCPEDNDQVFVVECSEVELGDHVYFGNDSADIQRRSHPLLDNLASTLQSHSEILRIRVDGHTDSNGTEEHNLDLSQRRAEAVMAYLIGQGVDASRLSAQGFGESRAIADNATAEGRQNNRRVEMSILEQEGCD